MRCDASRSALLGGVLFVAAILPPSVARAQGARGPSVRDGNVNYIDTAIPGTAFRLRYDSAYNNRRPTRAEFVWPRGGPDGPGPQLPERSVDYQDLSAYLEGAIGERLSAFVELPARFLNPDVNPNAIGLGDINGGFKYAFLFEEDLVTTFQFRTYVPSGDGRRGLGTEHVSLEPALLLFGRLDDRLAFESELRYWIPVGGTDFAGSVVRYGAGLHYDLGPAGPFRLVPVAELVGWTVLAGKETAVPPVGPPLVSGAAGDTIVNAKLGLRVKLGCHADVSASYGRPLTGERWYENVYRVELRLAY